MDRPWALGEIASYHKVLVLDCFINLLRPPGVPIDALSAPHASSAATLIRLMPAVQVVDVSPATVDHYVVLIIGLRDSGAQDRAHLQIVVVEDLSVINLT